MLDWLWSIFKPPFKEAEASTERGVPVDQTPMGRLYQQMQDACPTCHERPPRWMEGPSGGMSTNIFCGDCGAGFNVTPVIQIAERIGHNSKYIFPK